MLAEHKFKIKLDVLYMEIHSLQKLKMRKYRKKKALNIFNYKPQLEINSPLMAHALRH